MDTDASNVLQSVVLPNVEEPPAKPARSSSSHTKQQRQRTLSIGYSLNSNANFYDIPVVSLKVKTRHQNPYFLFLYRVTHLMTCWNVMFLLKKDLNVM